MAKWLSHRLGEGRISFQFMIVFIWAVRITFEGSSSATSVQRTTMGIRSEAVRLLDSPLNIRFRSSNGFARRSFTMAALSMQGRGVSALSRYPAQREDLQADSPRTLVSAYDWTCQLVQSGLITVSRSKKIVSAARAVSSNSASDINFERKFAPAV